MLTKTRQVAPCIAGQYPLPRRRYQLYNVHNQALCKWILQATHYRVRANIPLFTPPLSSPPPWDLFLENFGTCARKHTWPDPMKDLSGAPRGLRLLWEGGEGRTPSWFDYHAIIELSLKSTGVRTSCKCVNTSATTLHRQGVGHSQLLEGLNFEMVENLCWALNELREVVAT